LFAAANAPHTCHRLCARLTAQITHVGPHHGFSSYFDDPRLAIEVSDPDELRSLVLSYFIQAELNVEVTPTIVLPRGAGKYEAVRASLTNALDHRDIAARAHRMLTEQLQLNL